MVSVPAWIDNLLFLITVYLSVYQYVRLKRRNPVTNLQFVMIVFALAMILMGTLYSRANPWVSVGLLVVAAVCLAVMIRQLRTLPPMKRFGRL